MSELILDTSVISCFARADLLDLLRRLTEPYRRLVPRAVIDELRVGAEKYPALASAIDAPWLERVAVDTLDELRAFARYTARFGTERNIGESSVLAYAETHQILALVDDQIAVQVGRERKVDVRRSLALIARGIRHALISSEEAADVVDALIRGGARFPCNGPEFVEWAREQGLLG